MPDITNVRNARVLLVDDDSGILRTFRVCLEDAGCHVVGVQNGADALAAVQREVFDLCFLDVGLGRESGIALLPRLKSAAPWMRVVMATAESSVHTAVEAMQAGAVDYLVKPCSPAQLLHAVSRQMEAQRLKLRLERLESQIDREAEEDLASSSPAMMKVLDDARRVADTDAPVLILGESGTGKGVLARAIHRWSNRAARDLVTINCPSLSADLLESELFGHKKGAFTGATETTMGRVSQADGGTLFMDEIGDFPLRLQPKLLRFLQDKEYERVGEPVTRKADVRIIAATNRELSTMVAEGSFREDLFYRINVISIHLPPLRERREDAVAMAENFLVRFARQYRRPAANFSRRARAWLSQYDWPGNVRELRNVVERAAILSADEIVDLPLLTGENLEVGRGDAVRVGGPHSLEELERAHIQAVIARSGTLEAAAATLGIDPSTLYRKRKQFAVET